MRQSTLLRWVRGSSVDLIKGSVTHRRSMYFKIAVESRACVLCCFDYPEFRL